MEAPERGSGRGRPAAEPAADRPAYRALSGAEENATAEACLRRLAELGWTLATAESCTGGLVGALLTAHSGSSAVYRGGVVAYANAVKAALLDVPDSLLNEHGAVSEACAIAMARGVRARIGADVGISITGIAGPGGGSREKPVGLVWIGCATATGASARRWLFDGDRADVRRAAARQALDMASRIASEEVRPVLDPNSRSHPGDEGALPRH